MTREEVIKQVAGKTGLNKKDAEQAVLAMLETIRQSVKAGEAVSLRHFGTFRVLERSARQCHNPRTMEKMQIAARKAFTFKASPQALI